MSAPFARRYELICPFFAGLPEVDGGVLLPDGQGSHTGSKLGSTRRTIGVARTSAQSGSCTLR